MDKNVNLEFVSRFKQYVMGLRVQEEWVPDATEHVFMTLLSKGERIQKLLKNEFCVKLKISEPTLTRSLEVMEQGGFIKITSKRRSGTIITITNKK